MADAGPRGKVSSFVASDFRLAGVTHRHRCLQADGNGALSLRTRRAPTSRTGVHSAADDGPWDSFFESPADVAKAIDEHLRQAASSRADALPSEQLGDEQHGRPRPRDTDAVLSGGSFSQTVGARVQESGVDEVDLKLITYMRECLLDGFIKSSIFRGFIIVVILLNSVLVGLQTNQTLEEHFGQVFLGCDFVFLTIFVVEILLKWSRGFFKFWESGWNVFDFCIIFFSLLGQGLMFLTSGRALRIVRVLRALRTIKSISMVQGLQIVVNTVLRSLPDMGNIFLLLGIVMFIFAIVGVNIFGQDIPAHFGSLSSTMYTLFILLTQDGWVKIFKDVRQGGFFLVGTLYFFLFIIFGAFVFMNIISGVIVTNFQHAYEEFNRERQQKYRILYSQPSKQRPAATICPCPEPRPAASTQPAKESATDSARDCSLLTPVQLQRYMLVLAAIDENVRAHKKLYAEFHGIIAQVETLNAELVKDTSDWTS